MTTDGLRERKKRQTRRALSWAAVRLVAERGYDAVRIEDIAAEAGVSLRTFRNYFGSKGEAIAARHTERVRAIAEELRARPPAEPLWQAVGAAMEASFALGEAEHGGETPPDADWVSGIRLMMTQPALRGELAKATAMVEHDLTTAVAERTATTALYPRLVAAVINATISSAVAEWTAADPPRSMRDVLTEAIDLVRSGLVPPRKENTCPPR